MTFVALFLLGGFIWLGHWQWQRGEAKEAVWAEYRRNAAPMALEGRGLEQVPRFTRVELRGRFEPQRQFLLDNRSHRGSPGYEVLTPFVRVDGSRILVNRGWVAFSGYRDRLPDVSMKEPPVEMTITGRVDEIPVAGLASGHAPPDAAEGWPRLTSFPTHEELQSVLGGKLERPVLLLDAGAAEGFVREWQPPGLDPTRHYSYAIQWWGFAVVLLVLYFALNFRKRS